MSPLGQSGGTAALPGGPRGWTDGYVPLDGTPDEFLGPDGQPRPMWRRFLDALGAIPPGDLERRFSSADQHLRDTGVSYRAHGESRERAWPLSHLPVLIDPSEWRSIAAGVEQRARLFEAVLGAIYAPAGSVRSGIPAAAIAGSPDFLRPMVGVTPPGRRWMNLYAVDLGRGPDGRWWVLGDRTQAPSGGGYALENRLVLSRVYPELYAKLNVERLAPFFADLRAGLSAAAGRSEPRIALLTPGSYSETYFEQAYLARYLGLLLVEGDDLVVRDGRVHVRTIAGLKRVDVLWRRVDSDFLDPLELNAASRLGVPGLLAAIRSGGVAVANMPGSGVAEARALLGFLPAESRHVLGEDLLLPNIATWWCGQKSERDLVLERLDDLAIDLAASGSTGAQPILVSELDSEARGRLIQRITARGIDYVGQELVRLSTTPVWDGDSLVPRPFVLRVYAAATPDGWRVMPGAFCRIAGGPDPRAVSMGAGAQAADVWIPSDTPVAPITLLPARETVPVRRIAGQLPSRAADNLFWLGRYLERAEATLRVLRAFGRSLSEADAFAAGPGRQSERLQRLLVAWGAVKTVSPAQPRQVAIDAFRDHRNPGSIAAVVESARRAAAALRERLSPDLWHLLTSLSTDADATAPSQPEVLASTETLLRTLAAISGLASENMNRLAGWRFLDMGRRIERAINTSRLTRHFAPEGAAAGDLDILLDLADSQITYRSRYLSGPCLAPVRDLILLDPHNPRSVAFQVEMVAGHFTHLPQLREDGLPEPPRRLVLSLSADLATAEPGDADAPVLLGWEQDLMALADAIGARYFPHGPDAMRPEKLAGLA